MEVEENLGQAAYCGRRAKSSRGKASRGGLAETRAKKEYRITAVSIKAAAESSLSRGTGRAGPAGS